MGGCWCGWVLRWVVGWVGAVRTEGALAEELEEIEVPHAAQGSFGEGASALHVHAASDSMHSGAVSYTETA